MSYEITRVDIYNLLCNEIDTLSREVTFSSIFASPLQRGLF